MTGPVLLGMGWPPDQPGGLNRYFRSLVEALEELGAEPRALVVGPALDRPSFVTTPAEAVQLLPVRLWRLARAVPRAEVVDAHFALYAFLPLVLGPQRNAAVVVHFHGPWAAESRATGDSRVAVHTKRWLERRVYRRARRLVVLSHAFRRLLVESYGVSPWIVEVVPPGVDLQRFSPGNRAESRKRLDVDASAWIALSVRRLVPRMGLDVLLDAWHLIDRPNKLLLIAGDGPERSRLEASADPSVRFLGRVSETELVDCYRAADVSVVPSVALEGYGLVVTESLACGTPAVVTDVGGLTEAVAPLDVTVPAGDPEALAARLLAPLPSSEACRAVVAERSWSSVAERTMGIYAEAVAPASRSRPRVVYASHSSRLAGGELALLHLLEALGDAVEAHVILAEDGPLRVKLEAVGVSVEVLPLAETTRALSRTHFGLSSGSAGVRTAAYAARLAARLRRYRPDLLHTNSLKASLYGGAAGRLAGVPVIWHLREPVTTECLPGSAVQIVRAAAHVFPTAAIANSLATAASLPGLRPVVVPSPVQLRKVSREDADELRVGLVGRIARLKGQHVFLEAFARAFPDGSERAVLIGAPLFGRQDERYLDELRELAASLGLGDRVQFRGFREDVASELARLDIVVLASTVPEGFGQVIAEGLAAGLPVVAAAAGGPAEMIHDGVDGLLYPPGDVTALAGALRRLADDPALRSRLGQAGRACAVEFSPERVAAQVLETYRAVLGR